LDSIYSRDKATIFEVFWKGSRLTLGCEKLEDQKIVLHLPSKGLKGKERMESDDLVNQPSEFVNFLISVNPETSNLPYLLPNKKPKKSSN
tara:strand:- start:6369 stop:6638 length:270 start_codon:yes stop_codon:yes gene_type:complete